MKKGRWRLLPKSRPDEDVRKVLYFAVEDLGYPRNERIREYIRTRGAEVTTVVRPVGRGKLYEYFALLARGLRHRRGYSLVVLSEFSTNSFPISWLLARLNRCAHVVDFFVGKHETLVEDRRKFEPGHPKARLLRALDKGALWSADLSFSDTECRARGFKALVQGRRDVVSLPVGAPTWARADNQPGSSVHAENGTLKVLYYGHYAPLHGVDVLLEGILSAMAVVDIEATFVGDGIGKDRLIAKVSRLGLADRIRFVGFEEPGRLIERMHECDVVLGIFGTSDKAGSVIANKVWQGLYSDKIVITRRSEALSEIADLVGDRIVQVEPGDEKSVAEGLRQAHSLRHLKQGFSRPLSELLDRYVDERFDAAFSHPVLAHALGLNGSERPTALAGTGLGSGPSVEEKESK